MKRLLTIVSALTLVAILTFSLVGQARAAGIIYVKWNAGGANTGASWANAYTDLQSALSAAVSGDEIWVAAGTYKPTSTTDRTLTFTLKNGVALCGGFNGTETLRSQRNWVTNVTILSGDIGTVSDATDNSYHVLTGGGTDSTAVLDGFTVTAGNANVSIFPNADRGGGMYNYISSPSLTNLTFSTNSAAYGGGGMYNEFSSNPVLTNVTFSANTANNGGGMFNHISSPSLTNVTFRANTAAYGGGMVNYFSSNPILTNVTFSANPASVWGGGMYNATNSNPSLTNVTFSSNSAVSAGGGMYNDGSSPIIKDSIFWGNGTEFARTGSNTFAIDDSLVAGGCPTGMGATCTGTILNADPLLGALANNGGFTQTMALGAGSPAIDAGNNATCALTDQRGVSRPQGAGCDIGAFEVDSTAPTALSFVRQIPSSSPTNTDTLVFRATFSEAVTGVDMADFAVNGTTTATVTGVSPFSTSVYDVTVSGGDLASFNGVVGLDFSGSPSITDLATNAFVNAEPAIDQTYTLDNTPPTVAITSLASNPTHTSPIAVTVTFSKSVTGFTSTDIVPGNGAVSNFTVVNGTTYTFDLTPTANGLVTADIAAGAATDSAGNGNMIATQFSRTYTKVFILFLPLILR